MTENMTPLDWAKRPIQKYADFSGRAPRAEYWWYALALVVAYFVMSILERIVGLNDLVLGVYGPLTLLVALGTIVPGLAVSVRRLHDTDRSAWWLLLLVPYLVSVFLMVEIDARKFGMSGVVLEKQERALVLARRYWFHFVSLIAIVGFMLMGYSPILSVFWATVVTALLSFFQRDTAIVPYDWFRGRLPWVKGFWNSGLIKALEGGSVSMLNVAMTCAAAGIKPFYGPFGDFSDEAACEAQFRNAFLLGCAGAWTLHPSQIAVAKRVFSPDPAEVAFARRIIEAMPDGSGAVMIDGKMQDDATWKQAKVIVDLATQVAARDPDLARRYGL